MLPVMFWSHQSHDQGQGMIETAIAIPIYSNVWKTVSNIDSVMCNHGYLARVDTNSLVAHYWTQPGSKYPPGRLPDSSALDRLMFVVYFVNRGAIFLSCLLLWRMSLQGLVQYVVCELEVTSLCIYLSRRNLICIWCLDPFWLKLAVGCTIGRWIVSLVM